MSVPVPFLPRYQGNDPAVREWSLQLCAALDAWMRAVSVPSGNGTWSTANVTPTRSLDASTATLTQVANTLGTLILDLEQAMVVASSA